MVLGRGPPGVQSGGGRTGIFRLLEIIREKGCGRGRLEEGIRETSVSFRSPSSLRRKIRSLAMNPLESLVIMCEELSRSMKAV